MSYQKIKASLAETFVEMYVPPIYNNRLLKNSVVYFKGYYLEI